MFSTKDLISFPRIFPSDLVKFPSDHEGSFFIGSFTGVAPETFVNKFVNKQCLRLFFTYYDILMIYSRHVRILLIV